MGVRLVGVGLERLGVEEFVEGKFFNGELYLDEGAKSYKVLNLPRKTIWSLYGMLDPRLYIAGSRARNAGVSGNFKGNGLQLGATFIVDAGGQRVLFDHRQANYADHPTNEAIMEALQAAGFSAKL
eukprot:gnl/Hemi2/13869_TR4716_c0_g1_i1.p2 gnl/Hemi2/13869_TR4716_c0_g1~~gnl/Hemi2/13869_TR4716_c0_g1_i1.p2  ORF type:complete len:126 (+),score=36.32 gnl/Hemi2/13869_TR4716_c0_g1_i1:325-702(+)